MKRLKNFICISTRAEAWSTAIQMWGQLPPLGHANESEALAYDSEFLNFQFFNMYSISYQQLTLRLQNLL